ncbi:MAG: hypothetical protein JJV98_04810 [Desulfosarcina sp.]|nr:hypothetical protein [Desulfobacterales bacterium]
MRIVFGKQLTFGFDDQDRRSNQELIACVDFHSAKGDDILLATLVGADNRPTGVSKDTTVNLIADLIRDDQIRFSTAAKHLDKVAALAVLTRPDQWPDVAVIRATVVDPSMLARARQAAVTIFDETAPAEQSALCRWIRKQLRTWINAIASYQRMTDTANYPGKADMTEIVAAADRLLSIHNPHRFVEYLNAQVGNLTELARALDHIRVFYVDHGHIWQALSSAMTDFNDAAAELEQDPRCRMEFGHLLGLYRSRQPFAANQAILDEIVLIRSIQRRITHERAREAALVAGPEIDAMLAELNQALNRVGADSHLRNQVLYPLQRLIRLLDTAQTAARVNDLLASAQDDFDVGLDTIGTPSKL